MVPFNTSDIWNYPFSGRIFLKSRHSQDCLAHTLRTGNLIRFFVPNHDGTDEHQEKIRINAILVYKLFIHSFSIYFRT